MLGGGRRTDISEAQRTLAALKSFLRPLHLPYVGPNIFSDILLSCLA